jgi:hypothetical protein
MNTELSASVNKIAYAKHSREPYFFFTRLRQGFVGQAFAHLLIFTLNYLPIFHMQ